MGEGSQDCLPGGVAGGTGRLGQSEEIPQVTLGSVGLVWVWDSEHHVSWWGRQGDRAGRRCQGPAFIH